MILWNTLFFLWKFTEKKKKSTKCLLCILLLLSLSLCLSSPSIATSHPSMTELGRRVLHHMSDCISLSAGKARVLKGTILPSYLPWCSHISSATEKAFSSSSAKRYAKFTAAVKKQRTPVFTCCYTAEVRDKIRNQLKQCVMSVIVSPAQYQRVVCYGLFASQPALCELCECCRARCVCVYECVVVFVCVCVCVSLQNSRWYLVSGVSAVDI